jgi:hypothetical protein
MKKYGGEVFPALVINGRVVSSRTVPDLAELTTLITTALAGEAT